MEDDRREEDPRQYDAAGRVRIERQAPLNPSEEATISRLYYKPRTGFMNTYKLDKKARLYPSLSNVNTTQIKDWYWKQPVNQVHRQEHRPHVYTSIRGDGPGTNLQMDFLIYRDHTYQGYKYVLCIIDVFSRKAGAYPTTNRKAPTYIRMFEKFVDEELHGRWPAHLNCDNEFVDSLFTSSLARHGTVIHFSEVGESNKNSLVERFIRTLRGMLAKASWALDRPDWPSMVPELVQSYNQAYHRTIRARPDLVFEKQEPSGQILKVAPYDFLPGDHVRLKLKKANVFAKGERQKLSTEVYVLDRKVEGRWVLRDEKTGEVFDHDPVKPKDLQRTDAVWTTPLKEAESHAREEREKEQEAEYRSEAAPVDGDLQEERAQQERESGQEGPEDVPQQLQAPPEPEEKEEVLPPAPRQQLRRTALPPPRLRRNLRDNRRDLKQAVTRRELGDYNTPGEVVEVPLRSKRGRVPNRINRDLGYEPSEKRGRYE